MSLRARLFEVLTLLWRSRARTFLWPSPWKGEPSRTSRILPTSSASGHGPMGPGFRRGAGLFPRFLCQYTVERGTFHARETRFNP
jgi:hypothetical protein